jgi:hypothetical protein
VDELKEEDLGIFTPVGDCLMMYFPVDGTKLLK